MRRSFTGPMLLLVVGSLFLWHNLHPEAPVFDLVAKYWPFVLIAWGLIRLVEVSIWRRDGLRSGFTGGEVVLIVMICIAGSGIWAAHEHGARFVVGGMEWWGHDYDYPITAGTSAAGMKRIVFENSRGYVKITGSDRTDIGITGRKTVRAMTREDADRANTATPIEVIPQGDWLLVRTNQDRDIRNERITDDLEILLPRGLSIETRGSNGEYEVNDINGDLTVNCRGSVRIARVGGNVQLDVSRADLVRASDVKGRLDLQGGRVDNLELENIGGQVTIGGSFAGALEFKNLAKPLMFSGTGGTELSAQAVPGRISMDRGEFTARDVVAVRLVTGRRDIKVSNVTQSLEVETRTGDIEITPGKTPLPTVEARSGSGRIELVLPDKASFQLDGIVERGDALNDYGSPIVQDRQGRSATLKGKVGDGPLLKLTAARGYIAVRKEGTVPSEELPDVPGSGQTPKKLSPKDVKAMKDSEVKM